MPGSSNGILVSVDRFPGAFASGAPEGSVSPAKADHQPGASFETIMDQVRTSPHDTTEQADDQPSVKNQARASLLPAAVPCPDRGNSSTEECPPEPAAEVGADICGANVPGAGSADGISASSGENEKETSKDDATPTAPFAPMLLNFIALPANPNPPSGAGDSPQNGAAAAGVAVAGDSEISPESAEKPRLQFAPFAPMLQNSSSAASHNLKHAAAGRVALSECARAAVPTALSQQSPSVRELSEKPLVSPSAPVASIAGSTESIRLRQNANNQVAWPVDSSKSDTKATAADRVAEPAGSIQAATDRVAGPAGSIQAATDTVAGPAGSIQAAADRVAEPAGSIQAAADSGSSSLVDFLFKDETGAYGLSQNPRREAAGVDPVVKPVESTRAARREAVQAGSGYKAWSFEAAKPGTASLSSQDSRPDGEEQFADDSASRQTAPTPLSKPVSRVQPDRAQESLNLKDEISGAPKQAPSQAVQGKQDTAPARDGQETGTPLLVSGDRKYNDGLEPAPPAKAPAQDSHDLLFQTALSSRAAADPTDLSNSKAQQSGAPRSPDMIFQLAEKIQAQLQNGETEVTIQLKPETLGRMEIRAETGVQGVVARIVTESAAVKHYLESNLHILQQSLQDQGLKINRIDFVVQDGLDSRLWGGQQHSGQNGSGPQGGDSRRQTDATGVAAPAALDNEILVDPVVIAALGPNSTFHTVA